MTAVSFKQGPARFDVIVLGLKLLSDKGRSSFVSWTRLYTRVSRHGLTRTGPTAVYVVASITRIGNCAEIHGNNINMESGEGRRPRPMHHVVHASAILLI